MGMGLKLQPIFVTIFYLLLCKNKNMKYFMLLNMTGNAGFWCASLWTPNPVVKVAFFKADGSQSSEWYANRRACCIFLYYGSCLLVYWIHIFSWRRLKTYVASLMTIHLEKNENINLFNVEVFRYFISTLRNSIFFQIGVYRFRFKRLRIQDFYS